MRRPIVIGCFVIVAVGILLFPPFVKRVWRDLGREPLESLAEAERVMGLELPSGTVLIEGQRLSFPENAVLATLSMPSEAARTFLTGRPFDERPETSGERRLTDTIAEDSMRSWRPDSAREFIENRGHYYTDCPPDSSFYEHPEWRFNCFVTALADLDDPATATVYLCWTGEVDPKPTRSEEDDEEPDGQE